ncbi:MAG: DMT family transporter [Betaproteobacteria bacterium]
MSMAAEHRRAAIVMAVLAFVWGYSWIVAKIGLSQAGPFAFGAMRVVCGVSALAVFLVAMKRLPSRRPPRGAALVGVIQTGAFLILNTWALAGAQPGKISILTFTMPFWVLLFAWPVLGERVRGQQWFAIVSALIGLVLILEPWLMRADAGPKVLAVLAGMAWGTGVVLTKRIQREHPVDTLDFTFWQMTIGMVPIVACALLVPEAPVRYTPTLVMAVLFSGVIATGGGWLMWQYVLNRLPAGTTSLSSLAVPVVAIVSSALQLGERLRPAELVGASFIGLALGIVSWQAVRTHRPDEPSMAQE